jgi:hypothetical protein
MGETAFFPRRFKILTAATLALIATTAQAQTRVFDTQHYRIHTDLDEPLARDYARRLDAMHNEYARRLSDFDSPPNQKFEVHLFRKKSDYSNYIGNRLPNSAGIFIPAQRALAGYEEGQGRAGLRQTLQHEAFHQFAWETISPNLPIWLDEGLAQIFEEGVWTGNQFILGQVPPWRLAEMKADLAEGRFVDFKSFLTMSRQEFQGRMRDGKVGRAQYNQAWAMTHFLIFATDDKGQPRFRARLLAWLRDMHAGKDAQASFAANFSANIDGFQGRFIEWLDRVQPTPIAVYSDRMSKLAELVRLFKDDGLEFDSIDSLRKHLSRGRYHLTEERDGQTFTHEEDAMSYLSDLNNKPWAGDQLKLESGRGPLMDIVLRPPTGSVIRVRFYRAGSNISHEIVFETR